MMFFILNFFFQIYYILIFYSGIEIWMEYIQFSMAGMGEGGLDQMKKIRSVMEDAVSNGGLHAEKGALLWDTYRDFEILRYQSTKGVNEVESAAQIQHITQLFHRQLSIPLLNMVHKLRLIKTIIISTN